jgi:hypothetical protein
MENLFYEELSKKNNTKRLLCKKFMNNICIAHDSVHLTIDSLRKNKNKICKLCQNNFSIFNKNKFNNFFYADDYISDSNNKFIIKLELEKKTDDELKNFIYDGFNVGQISLYEMVLKKKSADVVFDTPDRKTQIDKIKQIILMKLSLDRIYLDFKPEFVVTTLGYYYITNFFIQYNKKLNIKCMSIANSSNYRFARKNLRIFHNNEMDDIKKINLNFKNYKNLYLDERNMNKCLKNIISSLNKEHSHSFAPAINKNVNIRQKFNIPKEKKIILVILSSQAEIFSAKHVLGINFEKNNSEFETQMDFVKFLLSVSNKLPDYHFILRTHPRQYVDQLSSEIKEMNNIDFSQYKNVSLNTPKDNISPFDFLKDVLFIINSWSTLAIDFGMFGINNLTIFPEYCFYPKETMNIIGDKNIFIKVIKEIETRNLETALSFFKYFNVVCDLATINFEKNFFLTNNYSNFYNNSLDKFFFKYLYLRIYRLIKNIPIRTEDKTSLDLYISGAYETFHEAKFNTKIINQTVNDLKDRQEKELVKNLINKTTKKYFNFLNFSL